MATHGMSNTPEYNSWVCMMHRCENPRRRDYKDYGGRGIAVCAAWHDFAVFRADMGPRPTMAHTLERRENSKGYSPSNCFWATKTEQARNTRRNIVMTHGGKTQTLTEWAIELNVPNSTLQFRVWSGWSHDRALTQPFRKSPTKKVGPNG